MPLTPTEHLIAVSDANLKMHQETKNASYKILNNIIFVVSSGALVVSITFIGYLKLETLVLDRWILVMSWFFLILTILGNFFVHTLQIQESRRQITLINEWRGSGFPNPNNFQTGVVDKDADLNKLANKKEFLNLAVCCCLFLGVLALFIFATINWMR